MGRFCPRCKGIISRNPCEVWFIHEGIKLDKDCKPVTRGKMVIDRRFVCQKCYHSLNVRTEASDSIYVSYKTEALAQQSLITYLLVGE
jgi:hypothetical protein